MSETIWADVLDKMYDLVIAETFIAAEITAERLKVFDGPSNTDFSGQTMMTIGALPVMEDESETSSEWNWAAMGASGANADVDDLFVVPCGIHTLLGRASTRTARRTAMTVFAKAAAFYRNTTLTLGPVMWLIPRMNSLKQEYTTSGAECLITFGVHVTTSI